MKTVILAGGFGTRISEESQFKPKPMLEIGEMPILWHIMKEYSHYGFNDFIICAGYKQHVIKEWFADYFLHTSDVTFDYTSGKNDIIIHNKRVEPWKVTVVDTGLNTMTGGRIKRIKEYVGEEPFMLTYGDAVGNIDINELLKFHLQNGKIGTISVYNFGQNKGVLDVNPDGKVNAFREKSDLDGDMIDRNHHNCCVFSFAFPPIGFHIFARRICLTYGYVKKNRKEKHFFDKYFYFFNFFLHKYYLCI